MLFNSFEFLAFFAVCLLVYVSIPSWSAKKWVLLAASYIFYAAWYPPYVLLLLFTSTLDYTIGRALGATASKPVRRVLLTLSITVSLALLAFFKYTPFLVAALTGHSFATGSAEFNFFRDLVVPIGLSFYTFQSIGYVIDVYRGMTPVRSIRDYFLFISFFPQLEAGPILRASAFIPQLVAPRTVTAAGLDHARQRLVLGFFQKVVLADNIAPLVNAVFGAHAAFGAGDHWIATYGFAFQIYFDFAGYSNIAIGLAAAFGFAIPDNFNNPYHAQSFREFWRRWHISFSSWLRDYLYIPLGGNRGGTLGTARNLLLTMLIGGLWHGANWTFVAWGALHGFYLGVERSVASRFSFGSGPLVTLLRLLVVFHLACLAWVFFRAPNIGAALEMLGSMMVPRDFHISAVLRERIVYVAAASAWLLTGWFAVTRGRILVVSGWRRDLCDGLMVAAIVLFPAEKNAFIYFQF